MEYYSLNINENSLSSDNMLGRAVQLTLPYRTPGDTEITVKVHKVKNSQANLNLKVA